MPGFSDKVQFRNNLMPSQYKDAAALEDQDVINKRYKNKRQQDWLDFVQKLGFNTVKEFMDYLASTPYYDPKK